MYVLAESRPEVEEESLSFHSSLTENIFTNSSQYSDWSDSSYAEEDYYRIKSIKLASDRKISPVVRAALIIILNQANMEWWKIRNLVNLPGDVSLALVHFLAQNKIPIDVDFVPLVHRVLLDFADNSLCDQLLNHKGRVSTVFKSFTH